MRKAVLVSLKAKEEEFTHYMIMAKIQIKWPATTCHSLGQNMVYFSLGMNLVKWAI